MIYTSKAAMGKVDADVPIFAPDAFGLNDFQAELIAKSRRFGQQYLAPRVAQHDRDATFLIENFGDMHPEGLLGICIPKSSGGVGADYKTYALCASELGRYCGATALSWNMHICSTLWSGPISDEMEMPPDCACAAPAAPRNPLRAHSQKRRGLCAAVLRSGKFGNRGVGNVKLSTAVTAAKEPREKASPRRTEPRLMKLFPFALSTMRR